jgi:hypothetical protein
VLQPGKAKRNGTPYAILKDLARAYLIIIDGARLLNRIIADSYEKKSIINTSQHRVRQMGVRFWPTTDSPPRLNRPHHSPLTPHRIQRPQPAHRRSTHVQRP